MDINLEIGLRNVKQSSNVVTELANIWPKVQLAPFRWDNYYRIFSTKESQNSYQALFGSYIRSILSIRSSKSQLRRIHNLFPPTRWRGPYNMELPLPKDAIIIPPINSKEGIVIASYHAGMILKINYNRSEVQKEIENWDIVKSAGIESHVPMLIDHGFTNDGGQWMLSELVPNTKPIHRPLNPFLDPKKIWRHWLRWRIFPTMERFYEASGLDILDIDDLLYDIKTLLLKDEMPDSLFKVAALAENARLISQQKKVIITTIHRDITPEHIHRNGTNWWIIDWGSSGRCIIAKEYFRNYFWTSSRDENHQAYWAWLRGDASVQHLPIDLRSEIDMYLDWFSTWQKTALDPQSLRCQLIIALLKDMHEVIIQFNLRDRLLNTEDLREIPGWARSISLQLNGLGAM